MAENRSTPRATVNRFDAALAKVYTAPVPSVTAAPVVTETLLYQAPESYTGALTTDEANVVTRAAELLLLVGWRGDIQRHVQNRRQTSFSRSVPAAPDAASADAAVLAQVDVLFRSVNWTRVTV